MGIDALHQSSVIYNNLLYNNDYNVQFDGDSHDVIFVYNTLCNVTNITGLTPIRLGGNFADMVFKDNLIVQDWALSPRYLVRAVDNISPIPDATIAHFAENNDIDYNVYYSDGNTATGTFYNENGSGLLSWVQWKALTGSPDANSTFLTSLPGFVSRYTDLHPADGGNLKDLGIDLVGYDDDSLGNPRGDPPTPGCYEEQTAS